MTEFQEILKLMPHRYPFLLVDRIIEFNPHHSIKVLKNVTFNEPFFQGHFPGTPVMPGVLMLEAMAQSVALLAFKSLQHDEITLTGNELFLFAGIDNARFRQPVVPGDQLIIESTLGKSRKNIWKASCEVKVGDKIASSADLIAAYQAGDQ